MFALRFAPRMAFALLGCLASHAVLGQFDEPLEPMPTPRQMSPKKQFGPPAGLLKLSREGDLWVDLKNKLVVFDGVVCLREGQLELFACPRGTKEHEAIVSAHVKPNEVHAALLAVGAQTGGTVSFDPKYEAAYGTVVKIAVLWVDAWGKQRKAWAQDWIRDAKTKNPMRLDWVFAGSGLWTDPDTGEVWYKGDGGDFVCVSNFPTATLDLPVQSSDAVENLLFEANTENIPPRGTPVRVVLMPHVKPTAPKP